MFFVCQVYSNDFSDKLNLINNMYRVLQASANKKQYNRVISTKSGETCFIFDSIRSGYNFGCVIVYL